MSNASIEQAIKELTVLVKKGGLTEFIAKPFGKGDLTLTGAQYCAEKTTTTANVNIDIEVVTVGADLPPGRIVEIEFALTGSFAAATSATADPIYQWQVRSKQKDLYSAWKGLHTAVTLTNIGTTNLEYTYSGRYALVDKDGEIPGEIRCVPFQAKLILQCNEANEGQAMTKNSSFIRVLYLPE